jgi:hypothetical protein
MPVRNGLSSLYAGVACTLARGRHPPAGIVRRRCSRCRRRPALGRSSRLHRGVPRKRLLATLEAAVLAVSVIGCSAAGATPATSASQDLTVYHWWTAGGEYQAMHQDRERLQRRLSGHSHPRQPDRGWRRDHPQDRGPGPASRQLAALTHSSRWPAVSSRLMSTAVTSTTSTTSGPRRIWTSKYPGGSRPDGDVQRPQDGDPDQHPPG